MLRQTRIRRNEILALLAGAVLSLAGCGEGREKFAVTGAVAGAKEKTIYLEAVTLADGIVLIDSARLDKDGAFRFEHADTTACPELYRLRVENQIINFAIDSTEQIRIEAEWPNMAFNYSVEGSGASDTIRQLSLMLVQLERDIHAMAENRNFTLQERDSLIGQLVKDYKDEVKIAYMQNNYASAASYFALFQSIGGLMLWNLDSDASDIRWASAVANAWAERWPGSLRAQNLVNIVVRGRQQTRPRGTFNLQIDEEKIRETGIIDMTYPDINGQERRLSDLRGQVVLLDFTAYAGQTSQERIIEMRSLYERYHRRGLEIYQVSVDANLHYWKTACQNLPWICVYNAEGLFSDMLTIYNVQALPEYFLIDRDCNLVSRSAFIEDLDAAIEQLL